MIIAYSFGMIDFLHYGRIRALKKAKANNDIHWGVGDEAMKHGKEPDCPGMMKEKVY